MGGIFSRMSDYVYNTVEGIRRNIRAKIDNTKNAIVSRVNYVKDGITSRVTNTRNRIYKVYDDTRTGVVTRVTAVRDGVVTRYTNVRDGIVWRYNYVKTKVTNTRDAVVDRYTRSRDYAVSKYTCTKDYCYGKYRAMREAELTRWQKFQYSMLFLFLVVCWFISMAILWDLWCGDLDAAADKVHAIWEFVCFVSSNVYAGTVLTLGYVWTGVSVAGEWTWAGTKIVGHHTKVYGTIAGEYAWHGTKVSGYYTWEGIKLVAGYIWLATVVVAENLLIALKVISEYLLLGSQLALDYTIYGSKVTAHYVAEGSKYSYEHGSVAAKDLSYRFGKWLIYFFTNFRAASYEAGVFLWETSIWAGAHFLSGSYTCAVFLTDATILTVTKSYQVTVAMVTWVYNTVVTVSTATVNTVETTVSLVQSGSLSLWDLSCQAAFATYTALVAAALWTYETSVVCASTLLQWLLTAAEFSWTWGTTVIINVSRGLYIGINRFGLKWLYALGNGIFNAVYNIGMIMLKFITEVSTYTANFIYVAGSHIYALLYIIVMFLYGIVSGVAAVIRSVLRGMSAGATVVFSAVMWVTNETLVAYMYMLAKYNRYREILFVGFVILMSMYCTGLVRDRRRDAEDESESDESEDEADGDKPRSYPSRRDLELSPPPGYSSRPVPAYQQEAEGPVSETPSHHLPSDSEDSEFGLEHDVPDFMELSGSDGEEDSPECDQDIPKPTSEDILTPSDESGEKFTPSEDDLLLDDPDSEGHLSSEGRNSSEGHLASSDPSDIESDPERDESMLALRVAAIKQQKEDAHDQ